MKSCDCAGINITWQCTSSCVHCFYRFTDELHTDYHIPLKDLYKEIDYAKTRGCNRVILIGYGEPLCHPFINEIIHYCTQTNIGSSIITNGSFPIQKYLSLYWEGLNHLNISAHAIEEDLNTIMERRDIGNKQTILMKHLRKEGLPFRTNITLQQLNYKELPNIVTELINRGSSYISLLNFLPHYHWQAPNLSSSIVVHPKLLKDFVETSIKILLTNHKLFTLRYFPMCYLNPKYWRYICNARTVIYDPYEWEYNNCGKSEDEIKKASIEMGNSVGILDKPCCECLLFEHCGGWNRYYAQIFNDINLKAITVIPEEYKEIINNFGGLFMLNPANSTTGMFKKGNNLCQNTQ